MNQFKTQNIKRTTTSMVKVPLNLQGLPVANQPISIGIPLPRGLITPESKWAVTGFDGQTTPVQQSVVSCWSDGSVKWLQATFFGRQLGFVVHADEKEAELMFNRFESDDIFLHPIEASSDEGSTCLKQVDSIGIKKGSVGIQIDTGKGCFNLRLGKSLLNDVKFKGRSLLDDPGVQLVCNDAKNRRHVADWTKFKIAEQGPLRAIVVASGCLGRTGLCVTAQFSFHAGSNLVRSQIDITNPNRARHKGGCWDLGDAGSKFIKSLTVEMKSQPMPKRLIHWRERPKSKTQICASDEFEIYQDSSGGEQWQSKNHVNRFGKATVEFRGYRLRSDDYENSGYRASPLVSVVADDYYTSLALEEFWQKFPSAIDVRQEHINIALWPAQRDLHELQGGERNSRIVWMDFGKRKLDPIESLSWVHDPAIAVVDPDWISNTKAIPYFPNSELNRRIELKETLVEALNGNNCLSNKRETIDEYGWRNFGDMWADHEEAFCEDERPVISHYNNQYDLLYGLLIQYLQTGDKDWWLLADPLARHVMTIDTYHTTKDKSAYNGGMFWHTAHYHDAATSTHRSYSRQMKGKAISAPGGGPANEHCYSSGLLLYYFLTGNAQARDAVIGMGDWVVKLDDGNLHLLGVISDTPTGQASCTRELDFQGPGRGAGNAIVALMNAWQLSKERSAENGLVYLEKTIELIRRTIHPGHDLTDNQFKVAEERWSYTVYLQSVFLFIEVTKEVSGLEEIRSYVKQSIRHYALWMLANEELYLDRPDDLEYPTETWAAQDLRKGVVMCMAATLFEEAIAAELRMRGEEILDEAWQNLMSFPTRNCTRPIAIVLQQCYLERFFGKEWQPFDGQSSGSAIHATDLEMPTTFIPQKTAFKRDLKSPRKLIRMLGKLAKPAAWSRLVRR